MRALLNSLGPVTHVLAGLIPLSFAVGLGHVESSLPLILMTMAFSLLPDIDSSQSLMGRIFGPISEAIEQKFGHRTLTHTAAFAAAMGFFCWAWFPANEWWIIWAAWLSHLIVDMCVGRHGVPLFWPLTDLHFYFISIKPRSLGELLFAACCALLVLLPFYSPTTAAGVTEIFSDEPTRTPTPDLLEIRIAHVFDPSTEILVQPGDTIERGQIIADLATYRQHQLQPTPPPADAAEPAAVQLSDTVAVSGDPTALAALLTPTADHAELQAKLREAQLSLEVARLELEAVLRSDASIEQKQIAEARLKKAEADFELARLKATPTATKPPTPTRTPRPTATPPPPQGDLIHAVVSGLVVEVRVESVAGEEAVVVVYVLRFGYPTQKPIRIDTVNYSFSQTYKLKQGMVCGKLFLFVSKSKERKHNNRAGGGLLLVSSD